MRKCSIYPGINGLLRVLKLYLYIPYKVDAGKNLGKNLIHDYLQSLYWITVFVVVMTDRFTALGGFMNNNPYKMLKQFRTLYITLYCNFIFCKSKTEYESIKDVFDHLKGIDETVRLTERQVTSFCRKLRYRTIQINTYFVFSLMHSFFRIKAKSAPAKTFRMIVLSFFIMQPFISDVLLWMLLTVCEQYYIFVHEQLERIQRTGREDDKAVNVRNLRVLYGKIHRAQTEINDLYADRILSGFVVNFFETIYFIFTIITIFKYWNDSIGQDFYIAFALLFIYVFTLFDRFWLIAKARSNLNKQRKHTSRIVHTLIDKSVEGYITSELSIFSLELLHRKSEITAKKFFTVDSTLLKSLLSGALTNILILMQMRLPGYENGIRPIEDLLL
ncbi:UNVERIFIED_CONTAM: hypothetical protein PYX00_005895 [Menopon gallinae]|uniref:Gustatory receptor n=1 Tax=Menopon gallinae TaxID=328185 RepID=A0AAW2HTV1_9NEOP